MSAQTHKVMNSLRWCSILMPILWQLQCHCCSVAIMKESTMKYARRAWTMSCADVEYDRYLLECYEECQLPRMAYEWQCQFCCKVVKCILRVNFHCVTGCPVVGILKMYPVVHKTNEMQWQMLSIRRVSWTLNRNLNLKFQLWNLGGNYFDLYAHN
jgi:hypothetical protein